MWPGDAANQGIAAILKISLSRNDSDLSIRYVYAEH